MNTHLQQFIQKERVGCLSVITVEGVPHAAAVHYSYKEDPLEFYIQTTNTTTKAQPFLGGKKGKVAFVIGFSEQDWLTLQMRGDVRIVTDIGELEKIYTTHYLKHPDAEKYKGPQTVFLAFTPTWWRFTDFNTEPETIVEL